MKQCEMMDRLKGGPGRSGSQPWREGAYSVLGGEGAVSGPLSLGSGGVDQGSIGLGTARGQREVTHGGES